MGAEGGKPVGEGRELREVNEGDDKVFGLMGGSNCLPDAGGHSHDLQVGVQTGVGTVYDMVG